METVKKGLKPSRLRTKKLSKHVLKPLLIKSQIYLKDSDITTILVSIFSGLSIYTGQRTQVGSAIMAANFLSYYEHIPTT